MIGLEPGFPLPIVSMKRMCHKLAAVAMALGVLSGPAAGAEKALTVVELFTSQGC